MNPLPCLGDAFESAGPRHRRIVCGCCANSTKHGGKCLSTSVVVWARYAGIGLESDKTAGVREVRGE